MGPGCRCGESLRPVMRRQREGELPIHQLMEPALRHDRAEGVIVPWQVRQHEVGPARSSSGEPDVEQLVLLWLVARERQDRARPGSGQAIEVSLQPTHPLGVLGATDECSGAALDDP